MNSIISLEPSNGVLLSQRRHCGNHMSAACVSFPVFHLIYFLIFFSSSFSKASIQFNHGDDPENAIAFFLVLFFSLILLLCPFKSTSYSTFFNIPFSTPNPSRISLVSYLGFSLFCKILYLPILLLCFIHVSCSSVSVISVWKDCCSVSIIVDGVCFPILIVCYCS